MGYRRVSVEPTRVKSGRFLVRLTFTTGCYALFRQTRTEEAHRLCLALFAKVK
jgi:hypothetical protein